MQSSTVTVIPWHTGTWVSVESLTSALQEEIDIVDAALSGLKGRLLVVFYEVENAAIACASFNDVEPNRIAEVLDEKLGFPFHAMCLVMSSREEFSQPIPRDNPGHGIGLRLYCELNTMPK